MHHIGRSSKLWSIKKLIPKTYLKSKQRRLVRTQSRHGCCVVVPKSSMESSSKGMCTVERRGRVHLITMTGAGEHRLNPDLLVALRSAVAASAGAGALVLAAEGKFFSNGFDLAWARAALVVRAAWCTGWLTELLQATATCESHQECVATHLCPVK